MNLTQKKIIELLNNINPILEDFKKRNFIEDSQIVREYVTHKFNEIGEITKKIHLNLYLQEFMNSKKYIKKEQK